MSDPTTSILLTGGAGYIGAATADALIAAGMRVVILDDLSSGHVDTIPNEASFKTGGYGETDKVAELLRDAHIDVIVHCGAKSIVAESSKHPERYFANNVQASLNLLDAACNVGVKRFLFASSAAVYGAPTSSTISETTALNPVNPYGATKVAFELA
ncbi:MAG: NAD-dependent epimerase/dehydratase family protein, partial [Candidatus Limnocylindrus sp.]